IELVESAEHAARKHKNKPQKPGKEGQEGFEGGEGEEVEIPEIEPEDFGIAPEPIEEAAESELASPAFEMTEKIEDPVRMDLTQMGEIPLLTREEEISPARKIELTRKQWRKETLSSGFGYANAIQILGEVVSGELAFDRTLKVNQQDPEVGKADLSDR